MYVATSICIGTETTNVDGAWFLAGATGSLPIVEDWTWDVCGSWGNVENTGLQQGNVSRSAFEELSLADDHGASLCGEALNPFGIGSISPECAEFVTRGAINDTTVRQLVGEAFVTGPLFELPSGAAPSQVLRRASSKPKPVVTSSDPVIRA